MKVAVVKYNAGNIRSVDYALKRLGVEAVITADKEELLSLIHIFFLFSKIQHKKSFVKSLKIKVSYRF